MQSLALDAENERAYRRLGTVLKEKWRIDDLLGVGGMAAVYAATHRNGKRVAVKIMHPEMSANRDLTERFLREGYVANKVAHPGAVSVTDDDVAEDGAAFIVMELLEGETLEQLWRRENKRLGIERVISIAITLLDVLAQAHEKGIVHRDIKPENVFMTNDGQVKVLDFGIAHLRELSARPGATIAGLTIGTPGYMSPEQARGESVDGRSDVWSVGATMFTLLAGRPVHDASTVNLQLAAAMMHDAPPFATVMPEAPAAVCALIDRALSFDMQRRWPDARSMQRAAVAITLESDGGIRAHRPSVSSLAPVDKSASGTSLPVADFADTPSPTGSSTWRDHVAANWRVSVVALAITAALSGGFLFVRGHGSSKTGDHGVSAAAAPPPAATIPAELPSITTPPTPPTASALAVDDVPTPASVASDPAPSAVGSAAGSASGAAAGSASGAPAWGDPGAALRSTSQPAPRTPAPPSTVAPRAAGGINPGSAHTPTPWPLSSSTSTDPLRRRK